MSTAGAAAGAAAARAAKVNAIRSFGVVVTVTPHEFLGIVHRQEAPLIVTSAGGFFSTEYRYLTTYKGLAFFVKSNQPIELPARAEIVQAQQLSIPV